MTASVLRALEVGYIERRLGKDADPDFNIYWKLCCLRQRPFVRIERRRGRCWVEADLFPTPQHFPDELQRRAVALLRSAAVAPTKAMFRSGSLIVSSDRVAPDQATRIAGELFPLACGAPIRMAVPALS